MSVRPRPLPLPSLYRRKLMSRDLRQQIKDLLPQTPSQTVLALGGLFLIGVVIDALLPYNTNTDQVTPASSARMVTAAAPNVFGLGNMQGTQAFVPSPPVSFGGRVTEVLTVGAEMGWGQVHIWINDGTGKSQEVSLAPESYLQQIGCPGLANARVEGVGFRFDPNRPSSELYAKNITVAGTICRLRDDEGLALWINPTQ